MFEISSESNPNLRIDIILLLKAIPIAITKNNINQVKKFQFKNLQDSFVAFKNADENDAFEHYDNLNNNRVQQVKEIELSKYDNLQRVDDIMKQISEKVSHAEFILQEFEKMWKYWEERRERIAIQEIAELHAEEQRKEAEGRKKKKDKEPTKTKSK